MQTDDFFRARLDQMIDLRHPLAVLANRMPWAQIESTLAPAFERRNRSGQAVEGSDLFGPTLAMAGGGVSAAGRPRLPIRLMAALLYLKHAFNLSDEELVVRWSENVVWQYFSGQAYYTPKLPCDATQIGRFRSAIGEAGVEELLKATIDAAVQMKAIRPAEFERVIVDTTVQERPSPIRSTAVCWTLRGPRLSRRLDPLASRSSKPSSRKLRNCAARTVATPTPSSFGDSNGCSSGSGPFWASYCVKSSASWLRPLSRTPRRLLN